MLTCYSINHLILGQNCRSPQTLYGSPSFIHPLQSSSKISVARVYQKKEKCLINIGLKHVRSQTKFSIKLTLRSVIIPEGSPPSLLWRLSPAVLILWVALVYEPSRQTCLGINEQEFHGFPSNFLLACSLFLRPTALPFLYRVLLSLWFSWL